MIRVLARRLLGGKNVFPTKEAADYAITEMRIDKKLGGACND
jgi:hypothetical protein